MKEHQFYAAAQAIREARETGQKIARISERFAIHNLQDAYSVANINTEFALARNQRIVGKKIGLTSKAVQAQLGVDQPDFGMLFDDMEYLDQDQIPTHRLLQPKAEAEVAFIVAKDFPVHRPSWSEFLNCLGHALAAIEIVDSVIEDWDITLADTIADNASCGLYVLAQQPKALTDIDFEALTMQLLKNGEIVSTGHGAACMGNPLRAAWWLACTMAEQGQSLKAGEVILSGALGPMVNIQKGDRLEAEIGALGKVCCEFI